MAKSRRLKTAYLLSLSEASTFFSRNLREQRSQNSGVRLHTRAEALPEAPGEREPSAGVGGPV